MGEVEYFIVFQLNLHILVALCLVAVTFNSLISLPLLYYLP